MMRCTFILAVLLFTGIACTEDKTGDVSGVNLSLSDWGPYTERYAGISHIADMERGLRFDLSVFPVTPGKRNLPFENDYSGGHKDIFTHWAARPLLGSYTLRFIMDQGLEAWCDVSFLEQDEASRLFRVDMHNESGSKWSGGLHMLAHLRYPPKDYFARIGHEPLRCGVVDLPDGAIWKRSLQYEKMILPNPDKRDALPERGLLRREVRAHGSVGGSLLGRGFGKDKGDEVTYRFEVPGEMNQTMLLLRGRSDGKHEASFTMSGAVEGTCTFPAAEKFQLIAVNAGRLREGSHELRLTSLGTGSVLFDGFVVVSKEQANEVRFRIREPNAEPEIEMVGNGRGMILSYPEFEHVYGFAIAMPEAGEMRSLLWTELYPAFGEQEIGVVNNMVHGGGRYGKGDPAARFVDLGFAPGPLPDGGKNQYWGIVCEGYFQEVRKKLLDFLARSPEEYQYQGPSFDVLPAYNADGEPYALSQQIMTATTSMNIIFPLLHERRYILGYEPSKAWSSVYTWDNGFHGIGLNILDTRLSAELMYQMTTTPGAETPYIWGGSPMPIQFYQFQEWWNRCRDRETMAVLYPRLKQMYEWFIGRGHGSTTSGPSGNSMISTFEYFYNTGWDDYPAHGFASVSKKVGWPAPVCQSVHTLIGARALGHAARELGLEDDVAVYKADARRLEQTILEDAWDEETGYFGYVVYDHHSGEKLGILRGRVKQPSDQRVARDQGNLEVFLDGKSGVNVNMGLDGVEPWFAGIGSPGQRERQFSLLSTEGRLWTPIGLVTVDLQSPFSGPGYWIDRAWIPPQWWFWKGALDQGKGEFAYRVAHAVLQNAMHTAEDTWSTYENFSFSTREPGGTGQSFAGLSTPSLDFFYSYYVPGTLSFGHDAWVEEEEWNSETTEVRTVVRFEQERPGENRLVLACFTPDGEFRATWNGEEVPVEKITDGAVYVRLPCNKERGELIIKKK